MLFKKKTQSEAAEPQKQKRHQAWLEAKKREYREHKYERDMQRAKEKQAYKEGFQRGRIDKARKVGYQRGSQPRSFPFNQLKPQKRHKMKRQGTRKPYNPMDFQKNMFKGF